LHRWDWFGKSGLSFVYICWTWWGQSCGSSLHILPCYSELLYNSDVLAVLSWAVFLLFYSTSLLHFFLLSLIISFFIVSYLVELVIIKVIKLYGVSSAQCSVSRSHCAPGTWKFSDFKHARQGILHLMTIDVAKMTCFFPYVVSVLEQKYFYTFDFC